MTPGRRISSHGAAIRSRSWPALTGLLLADRAAAVHIRVMIGRAVLLFAAWTISAAFAFAECLHSSELEAPPAAEGAPGVAESGSTRVDRARRVVVPVMVNGQGPFRFIVDTGANRSAISRGLAERLGLTPHAIGDVHSIDGVTSAPLVNVDSIQYGQLPVHGAALPMLEGGVLAGADGLLGVDGLQGRRLTLDFERRCIEIADAVTARRLSGWNEASGELRFGNLLLVEGRARGVRINILIDTGAGSNFANPALLEALGSNPIETELAANLAQRAETAGDQIALDAAVIIPRVIIGEVTARNVVAYVGDFHIFDLWGLRDEPTLLVGMPMLEQTTGLSIDYARAEVRFRFAPQLRTGSRIPGRSAHVTSIEH